MRQDPNGNIVLSQRNLLALLTKTFQEGSSRTMQSGPGCGGPIFTVVAETDEVHYGDRIDPPGPLHPTTQKVLDIIKRELNV